MDKKKARELAERVRINKPERHKLTKEELEKVKEIIDPEQEPEKK